MPDPATLTSTRIENVEAQQPTAVLLLGAAVDRQTMDLLQQVDWLAQVQTYRFSWALIHAIEQAGGRPIDVISTVPTRDFPFSRKIFWGPKRVGRDNDGVLQIMPLVNLLGLKQMGRFLTCLIYAARWHWQNRRRSKIVLCYGLIVPHLLVLLPLTRLFRAKLVSIVTDPHMNYWDEGRLYRAARWLDRRLLLMAMARVDGLIALTRPLAKLMSPQAPAVIIEGIISDEVVRYVPKQEQKKAPAEPQSTINNQQSPFTILYAGQLVANYGLRILIRAFEQLEGERFALWIFGQGDLEGEIREAAGRDSRITYWGNVPAEELFPRIAQASVMVNPRPADGKIAPYSFPSKLLEYLALGKVVVSARLQGIPPEYEPHLIFVDPMDETHLADTLRSLASQDAGSRRRLEDEARQFVWSNKTQEQQGRRIMEFLRGLV